MFEHPQDSPEQIPPAPPARPPLAPPAGPVTGAKAIFWNARELRAGWRLTLYALLFRLFLWAGSLLMISLHLLQGFGASITPMALLAQESVVFIAAVAAAALMGLAEERPFGIYGLPRVGAFGARFWQGAAWGIAMISLMILLIRGFGGFSFSGLALHGEDVWRFAVLWAVALLAVGFTEEFLFRGYAQFTLATGLRFWPAATVLSAAFGMIHLRNGGEDKIGAFGVFVIAMFFCLTLRRTGNLWFAVGLHAAFDWGETYLYSVPDSGIVAPGHLLNTTLHGPGWLTGGTVGPEGSVMAFVVVALAAILFARVYPAREHAD